MICADCGSERIVWVGRLYDNPHTECPDCGGDNCQEVAQPTTPKEPRA